MNETDTHSAEMPRAPAIGWACALGVGVACGEWFAPALVVLLGVALTVFILHAICLARTHGTPQGRRLAAGLLLLGWVLVGAARHAETNRLTRHDDLSRLIDEGVTVRLAGRLRTPVQHTEAKDEPLRSVQPSAGRSSCDLDVTGVQLTPELKTGARSTFASASGRVRVTVTGHLRPVPVGSLVEVTGRVFTPTRPTNPGEWDFAAWLRRQGCRQMVSVRRPEQVRLAGPPRWWDLAATTRRFIEYVRTEAESGLERLLPPRHAAVAAALLVGKRDGLEPEDRKAFVRSGTMHLLAVSGLHVACVAGLAWMLLSLLRLSGPLGFGALLLLLGGYALLTGARPSVLRASLFLGVLFTGRLLFRQTNLPQTLALAAGLLLLLDPNLLFDSGAQLSFLAVVGVGWGNRWHAAWSARPKTKRERLAALWSEYHPLSTAKGLRQLLLQSMFLMAGVWLWTAPLVATCFHLVSPIGLLLNVLLVPCLGVLLGLANLLLLALLCWPAAAPVVAVPVEFTFDLLFASTDAAAEFWLGAFDLPTLPTWWLVGYYLTLGLSTCAGLRSLNPRGVLGTLPTSPRVVTPSRGLIAWAAWLLLGCVVALPAVEPEPLRLTVLDVGHGSAQLVETPGGEVLLYDAGSLDDSHRVRDTVLSALRARGLTRIDAVVLSHADLDHYNALPELARQVPIGRVICSDAMHASNAAAVRLMFSRLDRVGVSVHPVSRGTRLHFGDGVVGSVLHPHSAGEYATDNQASLVLRIEYRARSLLLTGDIEGGGMADLTRLPSRPHAVVVCPHHGSANSNPESFAEWVRTKHLIVSSRSDASSSHLVETYGPDVTLWHTARDGAVTATFDAQGTVAVRGFTE